MSVSGKLWSDHLFKFVEGWVNTETLVGSLQTEAGNKSKDEIKSFLADFEIENDIGKIFRFFGLSRDQKLPNIHSVKS